MMTTIFPALFETVLTFVLLFILSKKHNVKWILISFAIFYVSMFAFFGDYTGSGSLLINGLAYLMYFPIYFIPYILYAIFNKYDSFLYTFIFPIGIFITEFIGTLCILSPGVNIAYRFFYANTLIQVTSLVGASGLSFILGWFISCVVTMISRKFKTKYVLATICSTLVLAGAFLFGVYRMNHVEVPTQFLRAAWATGPELKSKGLEWETLPYERNLESFLNTFDEAVKQEPELLIYAEEAFVVDEEKLDEFLDVASKKAKEANIAILLSLDVEASDWGENCNYYINRKGEIAGKYTKRMVIPIVEAGYIRGDGTFGKYSDSFSCKEVDMACSICYDGNFELYARRMQDDADVYLYPSWDWPAVENAHTMIAGFRAVENGIPLVKATCYGRSVMYDSYGRIIYDTHTARSGFERVWSFGIPLSDKVTFYEKYGIYEDIILFLFAAFVIWGAIKAVKKKELNLS